MSPQPFARCPARISSILAAIWACEFSETGGMPSWWIVMWRTGVMRFMSAGTGVPRAHASRETSPGIAPESGETTVSTGAGVRRPGTFARSSGQSGSGREARVAAEVPQPPRPATAAARRIVRTQRRRLCGRAADSAASAEERRERSCRGSGSMFRRSSRRTPPSLGKVSADRFDGVHTETIRLRGAEGSFRAAGEDAARAPQVRPHAGLPTTPSGTCPIEVDARPRG